MKTTLRVQIALFLVVVTTLSTCDAGQKLRLIRRITASDLPAPTNETDADTSTSTPTPDVTTRKAELLETRESSHRRRRPIPSFAETAKNSTELPNEVTDTPATTSRRPYVPVTRNVSPRSRSQASKTSNCSLTGNCEPKVAANEEKPVKVKSNSTTQDVVDEPVKKKTVKDKLQESSTVRPTDRTFNNIVSSSTARIVLQEKIHTDILRHLTTASYKHYETDYVLDEDADPYEAESQAAPGKRATSAFDHYAPTDDHYAPTEEHANATTPRTILFDEAYARVSEGIRQNLDDLVDRSEEYVASQSSENFESSEQRDSVESPPINDGQVTLEYINHVNIISNDSATANSRRGDLFVDNGTHVDFERSVVQTKVIPEVSSTVKYLIDDVHSTTKRIETKEVDDENNSINGSASSLEDQQVQGAEREAVVASSEEPGNSTEVGESDEENTTARLREALSQRLRVAANNTKNLDEAISQSVVSELPKKTEKAVDDAEDEVSQTTLRSSRMFPSDRYYTYNINNTVEQTATDNINTRPYATTRTTSYRIRRPSTTEQYVASRRRVEEATPTSGSFTRTGRPITRRPVSTPVTRRGAVKFGRNPEQAELYPIPPTAAAWSLATLKEPGKRTRIQNATTTRAPLEDSEASGSYNKQTTVFNILAPTNTTASFQDRNWYRGTEKNIILTTEAPNIRESHGNRVTTDYPSSEFTTETPSTTIQSELGEAPPTRIPEEATTNIAEEDVIDDDALRFDGVTTRRPIVDDVDVTTQVPENDNTSTTEVSVETTHSPREEVDHEDREEDVEHVTTEATPEADVEEYGNHPGSHDHPENFNKELEVTVKPPEEDSHGFSADNQPESGVVANKPQEEVHSSEVGEEEHREVEVKVQEEGVPREGDNHVGDGDRPELEVGSKVQDSPEEDVSARNKTEHADDSAPAGEEEADYGGPLTHDLEASVARSTERPTPAVIADVPNDITSIPITRSTVTSTTTSTTPTTRTTTTTTAATTSTTTPSISVVSDVHTFARVFVESSMQEFCDLREIFRKAVADLLTVGTGMSVSLDRVVLRNVDDETCADNTTSDAVPGQLIPVEMYVINDAGEYDAQLNNAFPLLWGHSDLVDFPLRIRKVDVVDESLTYTSGGSGNAAVIAAIAISCTGALCLLILAVLLIVMRKRQKKVNYGMRCTPVSLDAYSLDSVSIHGSTRRKGGVRASKRSYGNPAFDDPGSPSHPMNFAALANAAADRDALEEEFSVIPHVTPSTDELPEGCETRNRYANVIPLPETRVMLSKLEDEPLSDYINANYVRGPRGSPKCYIACQAPLQTTVTDFWRMVWEQQTKVIMMLTDLVENGVEKCADYLPPSEVLDCHRLFGDFQVTLKKREVREEYVISTLQLKNMESNSWREVTHLWYLSWPSQGVPEEASSIIAFLIEARSYMKNSNGPSVVHCSPGTGRTGTVLACDLGIREFEQTRLVDVPRCVARLRKDRAGCVQTRDQYAFIYQVLNLYATKLTGGALDSI